MTSILNNFGISQLNGVKPPNLAIDTFCQFKKNNLHKCVRIMAAPINRIIGGSFRIGWRILSWNCRHNIYKQALAHISIVTQRKPFLQAGLKSYYILIPARQQ